MGTGNQILPYWTKRTDWFAIFLGNGDGTFGTKIDTAVGLSPSALVTADFNADGKPDLAVTNSGSNTISVLLGNGDGTFLDTQTISPPASALRRLQPRISMATASWIWP